MENKKVIIISSVCILIVVISLILFLTRKKDFYSLEKEEITITDKVEVYSNIKLSDVVKLTDGRQILNDYKISTNKIGKQELELIYLDNDNDKRKGKITIEVVDETPPYIGLQNHYTHYLDTNFTFYTDVLCADNYDKHVDCEIIGQFDISKLGETPLKIQAIDSNGNKTEKDFILNVIEKPKKETNYITYEEIINRLPSNASLMIDVSKWDKDINWKKVKESGVEYAMIRLGTQKALDMESVVDPKFETNIKNAKANGVKVGIYYYSYANDIEDAKEQAEWVVKQIKNYDIDLPIAFDWESWEYFSEFNISIHDLNELARAFLDTVASYGYETIHYSSKNYLENIWDLDDYNIWLAHYTLNTNYHKKYLMWQFTPDGIIPGIKDPVDVNFYYNK